MIKLTFKEAEEFLQKHGYTLTAYGDWKSDTDTQNRHSAYATYTNEHGEETTLYYYFDRVQDKKDSWTAGEVWQVDGDFPMSVERFLEQVDNETDLAGWLHKVNEQDGEIMNGIIKDGMTDKEFEKAIRENPYEVFEQAKQDERLMHIIVYKFSEKLNNIEHAKKFL